MNPKTNLVTCIGIYLALAGLLVANAFLYLEWKHQGEAVRWEYRDFKCEPDKWKFSETNYSSGKITNYVRIFAAQAAPKEFLGERKMFNMYRVYKWEDVIQHIGPDGWELVRTDGTNCLVRRKLPKTKWKWDSFTVTFIDQNDEKFP